MNQFFLQKVIVCRKVTHHLQVVQAWHFQLAQFLLVTDHQTFGRPRACEPSTRILNLVTLILMTHLHLRQFLMVDLQRHQLEPTPEFDAHQGEPNGHDGPEW